MARERMPPMGNAPCAISASFAFLSSVRMSASALMLSVYSTMKWGTSHSPFRNRVAAQRYAHVLHFAESLEAVLAAFAPHAGLFHAAERLAQIAHILAVDEYQARFDAGRKPMRLADVLRPHVGCEAVAHVVGQA